MEVLERTFDEPVSDFPPTKPESVSSKMSSDTGNSTAPAAENSLKRKAEGEPEQIPASKKFKIINGVEIPIPMLVPKKKHIPARVLRAKLKQKRREEVNIKRLKHREEAIAEGTWDFEKETQRKKEKQIEREIKSDIKMRELAGEFGPVLPSPAELLKMEKEADKAGPEKFHDTALAKLSIKVHGVSIEVNF
jgi:hypothetical protein